MRDYAYLLRLQSKLDAPLKGIVDIAACGNYACVLAEIYDEDWQSKKPKAVSSKRKASNPNDNNGKP